MKLLPTINTMIRSDHADLVSRASKVVAAVCQDSPEMATVLCRSGLLKVVVNCLTPMPQFLNNMAPGGHGRNNDVSLRARTAIPSTT